MKKFYSGVTLNGEELLESDSSRIELEYYKISNEDVKKSKVYGLEIVKKEYSRRENKWRKAKNRFCCKSNGYEKHYGMEGRNIMNETFLQRPEFQKLGEQKIAILQELAQKAKGKEPMELLELLQI